MKSFDRPFSKGRRVQRQRLWSRTAVRETLWTPKKFLFLLLFLLAKGEKEDIILGYRTGLILYMRMFEGNLFGRKVPLQKFLPLLSDTGFADSGLNRKFALSPFCSNKTIF